MKLSAICAFAFLLFGLCACKKDRDSNSTFWDNRNPTSYVLKRQTFEHTGGTNGESYHFSYNSANLVSEIKRIQWGYGPVNIIPIEKWYDTSVQRFDYQNGLPVKCTIKESSGLWYYEYSYKGTQIEQTTVRYANGDIQEYNLYKYNSDGKISEIVDSTPGRINFRHVYEYNNNNLSTLTTYILWSTPQQKSKEEFSSFDGKVNSIRAVNGLPISHNMQSFSSFSLNNHGFIKHYWAVDMDKAYLAPTTMAYSYEYNEEGLPTKMYYGGWTVTYEYQKLK